MKIVYLGNHGPQYSTETHVAFSLEAVGHEVTRLQEGEARARDVPRLAADADLFVWTQTLGLAEKGGTRNQRAEMLNALRGTGIFSIGFHLDRWWGLARENQIATEPFFRVDLLATADGGHEREYAEAGINHVWSPPAVYHGEAHPGQIVSALRADVCFVGSWREYGHDEWWPRRRDMLDEMRKTFGDGFRCWPADGAEAVRGAQLNDVYASATVVVGDSCLVPNPDGTATTHYWSDRIPETLGRGGFLVHPWVEGLADGYTDGIHLRLYELGNLVELRRVVEHYVARPDEARAIALAGQTHVRQNHTYRHRMERLLKLVRIVQPT